MLQFAPLGVLLLLLPLTAQAQKAPPAKPFQRLDGCTYKPQRWNDGDGFHVVSRDGRETIFRLYFVDTPEEEHVYRERLAEQAAYFGITPNEATAVGVVASQFTKKVLAKAVTVVFVTIPRKSLGFGGSHCELCWLRSFTD